ncbi:MAG TPA: IS30 family transposase [Marmoricola sp.]|nr:IS30 family transposase [Marmoricola sp.]
MTFSLEIRAEFFALVCAGMPLAKAAELVGVSAWSATMWWQQSGVMGLNPLPGKPGGLSGSAPLACPGTGTRRRALTSEDRAVIAAGLDAGWSYRRIGRWIGRDVSVVSREVERNRGRDGSYVGAVAHRTAHEQRRRPKVFKLVENSALCRRIEGWMDEGWSPKLIALMLAAEHPAGSMERVSYETIYQALYVQTRGRLRADLHKQLSLKRSQRKTRGSHGRGGSPYVEAFRISQRPAEVEDRAVPGHWEGDLILGTGNASAVGTLVERSTRFTILLHLPGRHDADSVAEAMIKEMSQLPEHLRRSITWDRGGELAAYQQIQVKLGAPVFFCDPYSPWQRGTNENTNRLLRFWLKKSTDLSVHGADDLKQIADTLNRRPRPTLDLQTPAQRMNQLLTQAA